MIQLQNSAQQSHAANNKPKVKLARADKMMLTNYQGMMRHTIKQQLIDMLVKAEKKKPSNKNKPATKVVVDSTVELSASGGESCQ